jgi:hypothetical protein
LLQCLLLLMTCPTPLLLLQTLPRVLLSSCLPGPALQRSSSARVILVPNTPEVAALAVRVAKAVSCPDESYKRLCSPARPSNFPCMFGITQAPLECQVLTGRMHVVARLHSWQRHHQLNPSTTAAAAAAAVRAATSSTTMPRGPVITMQQQGCALKSTCNGCSQ